MQHQAKLNHKQPLATIWENPTSVLLLYSITTISFQFGCWWWSPRPSCEWWWEHSDRICSIFQRASLSHEPCEDTCTCGALRWIRIWSNSTLRQTRYEEQTRNGIGSIVVPRIREWMSMCRVCRQRPANRPTASIPVPHRARQVDTGEVFVHNQLRSGSVS